MIIIKYECPIDTSFFDAPEGPSYQTLIIGRDENKFLKSLISFFSKREFVFGLDFDDCENVYTLADELPKILSEEHLGILMSATPTEPYDKANQFCFVKQIQEAIRGYN